MRTAPTKRMMAKPLPDCENAVWKKPSGAQLDMPNLEPRTLQFKKQDDMCQAKWHSSCPYCEGRLEAREVSLHSSPVEGYAEWKEREVSFAIDHLNIAGEYRSDDSCPLGVLLRTEGRKHENGFYKALISIESRRNFDRPYVQNSGIEAGLKRHVEKKTQSLPQPVKFRYFQHKYNWAHCSALAIAEDNSEAWWLPRTGGIEEREDALEDLQDEGHDLDTFLALCADGTHREITLTDALMISAMEPGEWYRKHYGERE